ncbi:hypothetical protein TraAM80_07467 [Trypanosoma rangeli]|uniref:Uncharacterized protein n=1 Tax=Trypanosoma rangeli TaxID=5698 RepID=A0A422N5A7_TRYRA|nr:uncharacterized protein TraAM80_07467 [Trypanosoma rangeli]RNF00649.1 hypothetical protein TraAM80_07467 [Trypanosoma rangeli]|eukprot:RNF00649.1 hypothetical protein TraAM80_07467 [Trypanosoma rangeli]
MKHLEAVLSDMFRIEHRYHALVLLDYICKRCQWNGCSFGQDDLDAVLSDMLEMEHKGQAFGLSNLLRNNPQWGSLSSDQQNDANLQPVPRYRSELVGTSDVQLPSGVSATATTRVASSSMTEKPTSEKSTVVGDSGLAEVAGLTGGALGAVAAPLVSKAVPMAQSEESKVETVGPSDAGDGIEPPYGDSYTSETTAARCVVHDEEHDDEEDDEDEGEYEDDEDEEEDDDDDEEKAMMLMMMMMRKTR